MEKLAEYLAVFDEEYENIFAISLVDKPANEFFFVNLSKEEIPLVQLQIVDEEKRLVTGVVLVPEQKILRYDEKTKEHYYLVFTEEDIAKFSRQFIKSGYQMNSTENHDYGKQIENLTFVETWLVGDPSNDKASALGFDVPKGTWMVSGYVEDDTVLSKIKNNELNGFSIDGILKKVKRTSKNTNMSLLEKLFALVQEEQKITTKLAQEITTENYGVLVVDSLTEGTIVYDMSGVPQLNIEFEFEGNKYQTDDTGAISAIIPLVALEELPIDPPPIEALAEVVMENGDVFTSESFSVGDELYLNGELYVSQTTDIEGRRITTDENGVIISNEEIVQEVEELKVQLSLITQLKQDEIALKAENLSHVDKITELEAQITTLSAAPATGKLKAINPDAKAQKENKFDVFNRIASQHKK